MRSMIEDALAEASESLLALQENKHTLTCIEDAARMLVQAFSDKRRAFSCGNGGSMSDAIHFAEELSGRFRGNRPALPAIAISDPGHLTCAANDFGFEFVFSRFLEAHCGAGDVLVAISTSGRSPNILRAAKTCQERNGRVIALTGRVDSELGKCADIEIATPAGRFADRVQELHIKIIHILIELVEAQMFADCKDKTPK